MDTPMTTIAQYDPTEAALTELESRYKGIVFDFSKKSSLNEAKEARTKLRDLRIGLENLRKKLKAPVLEKGRQIDLEATRITDRISTLETDIVTQVEAEEQRREEERQARAAAEKERLERTQAKIENMRGMPLRAFDLPSHLVEAILKEASAIVIDDDFGELKNLAQLVLDDVITTLKRLVESKRRVEQEAERLKAANKALESQVATLQNTVATPRPVTEFRPFASIGTQPPAAIGIPPIAQTAPAVSFVRAASASAPVVTPIPNVSTSCTTDDLFGNTSVQAPSPASSSSAAPTQADTLKADIVASLDNMSVENLQKTSDFIKTLMTGIHFRLVA